MKKLLLTLCTALAAFSGARADEGMWIPSLIGKNYDEMVRLGLTLTREDLYNINQSSLKDAVVQFGGGCTAEMISGNGLLITNHHCGYDAIASLSSVQKNYLDNGFWSHNMMEELPAPNLSVIFLQRIDDVTAEMTAIGKLKKGELAATKMEEIRKKIEERAAEGGKYVANVKEYFNGNQYLLLIYKRYTDVRLVGTPPKSLGKYGGDTDNWMWPRHTADFSMFRVYAGKDNEPAAYSTGNVPYHPKRYLPVSVKGVQEGDYAMIFGYPGRTNRYEVSEGVDMAINEVNPSIVKIRDMRLRIMKSHMDADKSVYLKLTSTYASVANYWKYFIGQTEQLKRLNVVGQKRAAEDSFAAWARRTKRKEYVPLMSQYASIFAAYRPYAKHVTYYGECFRGAALARMASALEPVEKALKTGNTSKDTMDKYIGALKAARAANMKLYDRSTELELLAATMRMFYTDVPKSQLPDIYTKTIFRKWGSSESDATYRSYAEHITDNTFLLDDARFNEFCANPTLEAINSDPAAEYALSFVHNFYQYYAPKVDAYNNMKREYAKTYIRGLMEMKKNKLFYPDANSTMRITYGKVLSYSPQDAVHYDYFTTLDGFMAKYKAGDEEFDAPRELVDLYKKKDYGRYMDKDSTLHTCFITNNDITGGNSGSPVMNGAGEWIGIAFDGNWEAMSGDIAFDQQYKRTIIADSRYILFLIDKLGGAANLIEEMDVRY